MMYQERLVVDPLSFLRTRNVEQFHGLFHRNIQHLLHNTWPMRSGNILPNCISISANFVDNEGSPHTTIPHHLSLLRIPSSNRLRFLHTQQYEVQHHSLDFGPWTGLGNASISTKRRCGHRSSSGRLACSWSWCGYDAKSTTSGSLLIYRQFEGHVL